MSLTKKITKIKKIKKTKTKSTKKSQCRISDTKSKSTKSKSTKSKPTYKNTNKNTNVNDNKLIDINNKKLLKNEENLEQTIFVIVNHEYINPFNTLTKEYIDTYLVPQLKVKPIKELKELIVIYDILLQQLVQAQTEFIKQSHIKNVFGVNVKIIKQKYPNMHGGKLKNKSVTKQTTNISCKTLSINNKYHCTESDIKQLLIKLAPNYEYINFKESYPINEWQHIQPIMFNICKYSVDTNVYGMQRPNYLDKNQMFNVMSILLYKYNVTRYITVDNNYTEQIVWNDVVKTLVDKPKPITEYYNRKIIDFTSFTPHNALWFLKNFIKPNTNTVLHCTAGFGRTGSVVLLYSIYEKIRALMFELVSNNMIDKNNNFTTSIASILDYDINIPIDTHINIPTDNEFTNKKDKHNIFTQSSNNLLFDLLNTIYPPSPNITESPAIEVFHGNKQLLALRINTIKFVSLLCICQDFNYKTEVISKILKLQVSMQVFIKNKIQNLAITITQPFSTYVSYMLTSKTKIKFLLFSLLNDELLDTSNEFNILLNNVAKFL